jgi:hypothetical protein
MRLPVPVILKGVPHCTRTLANRSFHESVCLAFNPNESI